ncbi:MAG: hypothetical protein Tsb0015_04830 [Simkaniaceae bacterium]
MILEKFFSLILSALPISSPAAVENPESLSEKVERLEKKIEEISVLTAGETCGANTALARPILDACDPCDCRKNWFFTLSGIVWHAKVGGTEFAYSSTSPSLSLPLIGRTKKMDLEWDLGLQGGIGYQFHHGGWDAYLQFTAYSTNASKRTKAGSNSSLIPLRGYDRITEAFGSFVFCATAKSQFALNFRRAELELGRHFFLEEYLSFRPHIGVGGYLLHLDQTTRYYGGEPLGNLLGIFKNAVHIHDVSCFWGAGPEMGTDSKWHLGKFWSLVGDIAAGIYYGRFEVHHAEKFSLAFPKNVVYLKENFHSFTPGMRMKLGFEFDSYFNQDQNHFRMNFCYSCQYYWRANQMQRVSYPISDTSLAKFEQISADIGFHGFELSFRLDY